MGAEGVITRLCACICRIISVTRSAVDATILCGAEAVPVDPSDSCHGATGADGPGSGSELEYFIGLFQTQATSAKTTSGGCSRGHLEK